MKAKCRTCGGVLNEELTNGFSGCDSGCSYVLLTVWCDSCNWEATEGGFGEFDNDEEREQFRSFLLGMLAMSSPVDVED